jgi:hypothetical protein
MPVEFFKFAMMKDSQKKAITSSKFAEFNNVVCCKNTMMP